VLQGQGVETPWKVSLFHVYQFMGLFAKATNCKHLKIQTYHSNGKSLAKTQSDFIKECYIRG